MNERDAGLRKVGCFVVAIAGLLWMELLIFRESVGATLCNTSGWLLIMFLFWLWEESQAKKGHKGFSISFYRIAKRLITFTETTPTGSVAYATKGATVMAQVPHEWTISLRVPMRTRL